MKLSAIRPERCWALQFAVGAACLAGLVSMGSAMAADLKGQVLGAGAPIENSTVTLWAASSGAPKQLAEAHTDADGHFTLSAPDTDGEDSILYVVRPTRWAGTTR